MPVCINFCEANVLQHAEAGTASAKKMKAAAKRLLESMRAV